MGPRSCDPLTAATTTHLVPALRSHGFDRWTRRSFARVRDHALQFVDLQLSAWGSKAFHVNYAAMLLFPEQECPVLTVGGRIEPEGKPLSAETDESAHRSMRAVVDLLRSRVAPWFDETDTIPGYLAELDRRGQDDHHSRLDRGCGLAWLDRRAEAVVELERAIALYAADGRAWCEGYAKRARALIEALDSGRARELLLAWERRTIDALRLGTLMETARGSR